MTNEDIKAALISAKPVPIILTEEEEAEVVEAVFGGDRVVANNYKKQATKLFQDALDTRVNRILDEARHLLEQREEQLTDLQEIALALLKDKIIERMTPRLSMSQREKVKSYAVSWEFDVLGADPFGEFGMRVEKFARDCFPRPAPRSTGIDELTVEGAYVIDAADPAVEQAVNFSQWLNGRRGNGRG